MSERGQAIMIWWGLAFTLIFGTTMWTLLHMVTPPSPTLTPLEVAAFYIENAFQIKLGATICSWTSAFMVPISVVVAVQMARIEQGRVPIWSILAFAGGILMSMFLVFPPILWGIAAFNPARLPEATALINEMANLTLTTTDQFFIFQMIAITYVSLTQKPVANSAFPRWFGWFNLWIAIMFEVGALAFMFKAGPFAWNGLFVFWFPFLGFGLWIGVMSFVILRALKGQAASKDSDVTESVHP
ncbi:hypothetical protein [Ferribacterium limneticum]|uniref:hypothetical protein n=1 Tax=Ferribacterium limneticum TaxID=76259 RepID=UPI001CF8E5D1|nr:hypothetical protein [Ferribacterium limneticum]UCV23674.1 hypothetical protein KI613_03805 [Ferribacterium limneticum]